MTYINKPTQTPATAENNKWLHFRKFMTPHLTLKEKHRILPESTPALRIRGHLWWRPFWHTKNWVIGFVFSITARTASAFGSGFISLARTILTCMFQLSEVDASKPTAYLRYLK